MACAELAAATTQLDEVRGLPSRRQVACAELELDRGCFYPAGRGQISAGEDNPHTHAPPQGWFELTRTARNDYATEVETLSLTESDCRMLLVPRSLRDSESKLAKTVQDRDSDSAQEYA